MKPLNIRFLLPFGGVTGGIRAVVEIADRLEDMGHATSLVMPKISICSRRNRLLRRLPGMERFLRRNVNDLSWAAPRSELLEVETLAPGSVPAADVLVATAWQTAECLMSFPPAHGAPLYFIQHYEIWSGPRRLVDRTWRAGFPIAVTAPWLADLAKERFGIEDVDHVPYGVDPELFHPDPKGSSLRSGGFRVGLLAHPASWKGTRDGLDAIRRLRTRGIDARPVAFGTAPWSEPMEVDRVSIEFHLDPPQNELRRIYSSLDAFLCPSHTETGPLTVLEAMACGVPVVSTDVGNVRLWTGEGRHAMLVKPGQVESMARALERYAREPGMASSLAERARERACRFTWDASARAMEDALRRAVRTCKNES